MGSVTRKLLREDVQPHPLLEAIREVCMRIDVAHSCFQQETDPDLIEANIYELQSLRAKYRYLLRTAKNAGITCDEKAHLWNE